MRKILQGAAFAFPLATSLAISPDFNGDGWADLAVGVPGENNRAGAVNVIYGSGNRLNGTNPIPSQLWNLGIDNSRYGEALAWGDFYNDTFTDLAVATPGFWVMIENFRNRSGPGRRSGRP
jgi:hypothetical protein